MKNLIILTGLFLLIIIGLSHSCKNYNQKDTIMCDSLSTDSQKSIINDIIKLTDSLANDLCKMDFENALRVYDSTNDFRYAANGEFFKDFKAWKEYLIGHKATTDSLSFKWTQRNVVPLHINCAALTGTFDFRLKFKTGEVFAGKTAFTGLFLRKNYKWVMLHGHESDKH